MKFCNKCVLPDTRPGLYLDFEGICNACLSFEQNKAKDWKSSEEVFMDTVRRTKVLNREYDCVIPISGGKDSYWQTITCIQRGLRPLCVTWKPPLRTKLGQQNLDNLIRLGVDHLDYSANPAHERRAIQQAFELSGDPSKYIHRAIKQIAIRVARSFVVPFIIWGENPVTEYQCNTMGNNTLSEIYLGDYFPWDAENSYKVATDYGFKAAEKPLTGYYVYADIDDPIVTIHHWLKWHKFGFTRLHDNLSLEIRHGRMTREKALNLIKEDKNEPPLETIDLFCAYVSISQARFFEVVEEFTNKDIHANLHLR